MRTCAGESRWSGRTAQQAVLVPTDRIKSSGGSAVAGHLHGRTSSMLCRITWNSQIKRWHHRPSVTSICYLFIFSLSLISGRCGHGLLPCRSIQSASPCHRQGEIKRAQIVLNHTLPGLPHSVERFCIASLWEDPECKPEEIKNGLDWCRHDRGGQRKTGTVDG